MIRGPVLPQMRDGLWTLVAGHLESIETGLALVLEGLDCSGGHLGAIDGLARDAAGAPVLLVLAIEGDALLAARVLSAAEFLSRVGDSLTNAIPEAHFAVGVPGRVIVVGSGAAAGSLEFLQRLRSSVVEVCRLEPFRVAGTERFAVRWLTGSGAQAATPAPRQASAPADFVVAEERRADWQAIEKICRRLDPAIRMDGDRFLRRITWRGHLLGEVCSAAGGLRACGADGVSAPLLSARDVREFGDKLVRRYAVLAGLAVDVAGTAATPTRSPEEVVGGGGAARLAQVSTGVETLRSTLSSARLTPEEYSALGGPARVAGGGTEVAGVADDVVRIVSAQEGSWAGPMMRTD